MAGKPKQKLKLLYIADRLMRFSDEDHPISVNDLLEYLQSLGITAERKSIYTDIATLQEYGMDIKKSAQYHKGYYIAERDFLPAELVMLADVIQASPVISRKKTEEMIAKLRSLTSTYSASRLLPSPDKINSRGVNKSDNDEFYNNVVNIHLAINRGRRIRFIYRRRTLMNNIPVFDTGREFVISPYAAVWSGDKYYLVGNYDKYDNLSHYRIDRMRSVQIVREPSRRLSEVSDYKGRFDTVDYASRVFNMFAGEDKETVELDCDMVLLDEIVERFGRDLQFRQLPNDRFCVKVSVAPGDGFEKWVLNFGGGVTVRSPEGVRQSIKRRIEAMLKQYN